MTIGEVMGAVALERGLAGAREKRWVQVRSGSCVITALDPVGARRGEIVLLATGERAGQLSHEVPVDAVVVGIVEETGNNG